MNLKYLTADATSTLIHAYILKMLDTYNCTLAGIPATTQLNKLQRVQNAAAKLIVQARKYDSVSAILINLHWLPITKRIEFKILLITFKSLHDLGPVYLKELLIIYVTNQPPRIARDGGGMQLTVPKTKTVNYGD